MGTEETIFSYLFSFKGTPMEDILDWCEDIAPSRKSSPQPSESPTKAIIDGLFEDVVKAKGRPLSPTPKKTSFVTDHAQKPTVISKVAAPSNTSENKEQTPSRSTDFEEKVLEYLGKIVELLTDIREQSKGEEPEEANDEADDFYGMFNADGTLIESMIHQDSSDIDEEEESD